MGSNFGSNYATSFAWCQYNRSQMVLYENFMEKLWNSLKSKRTATSKKGPFGTLCR